MCYNSAAINPLRKEIYAIMKHWLFAIVLLVPLLAACDAGAPAATPTPTGPPLSTLLPQYSLVDLVMLSKDEGWVVGTPNSLLNEHGLVLHYTKGTWQAVANPAGLYVKGLAARQPGDLWVIDDKQIMEYKAGQWATTPNPSSGGLDGVTIAPDGTVWVVGWKSDMNSGPQSTIIKGDHGTWAVVKTDNLGQLNRVTMTPGGTLWTVGAAPNQVRAPGIASNAGGTWTVDTAVVTANRMQIPSPLYDLNGIQMLSDTDGWAVGNGGILHYIAGTWSIVTKLPPTTTLYGISLSPKGDEGWAVGTDGTIMRYKDGAWTDSPSPTDLGLRQVAWVSSDEAWAVGGEGHNSARGIILHYQNGAWAIYNP